MDYESLSLGQALKRWPRVAITAVCLALNVLLWGYDTGIVGGMASLVSFRKVYGEERYGFWIIPSVWLSLWAVAYPLGAMSGAAAAGWIQDRLGRKSTLYLGAALSVVAITIAYLSDRTPTPQATYFGAKLTQGVAAGTLVCSTQTYLSEVVPSRLRGPVMALFPAFLLVGQLIAAIVVLVRSSVDGPASYRIAIVSEYPLSIVPLLLAIFLPESPVWLLRKNKISAAENSFRKIHGASTAAAHQDLLDDMSKAIHEEAWNNHNHSASYSECFRGTNLRRTFIVVFCNCISELIGFNVLGNISYVLQILGVSEMASFALAIVGILFGLGANVGSFWTLLKYGRRTLILSTLSVVAALWVSVGIAGCFESTAVGWYSAIAMTGIVISAGLGCWPASFVVAAETSSLTLRSKTSGLGGLVGGIIQGGFGLGAPYLYNPDAANLGGKVGFVFFGTSLVGVLITWFFVPELKGKSAVEIDRVFEKRGGSFTGQYERVATDDSASKMFPLASVQKPASGSRSTSSVFN